MLSAPEVQDQGKPLIASISPAPGLGNDSEFLDLQDGEREQPPELDEELERRDEAADQWTLDARMCIQLPYPHS